MSEDEMESCDECQEMLSRAINVPTEFQVSREQHKESIRLLHERVIRDDISHEKACEILYWESLREAIFMEHAPA